MADNGVIDLDERRRMRDAQAGWEMVLAFDTDDPEFARGVEVGRLYAALQPRTLEAHRGHFHASNGEMIRRVAAATGYGFAVDYSDPIWTFVEFTRGAAP